MKLLRNLLLIAALAYGGYWLVSEGKVALPGFLSPSGSQPAPRPLVEGCIDLNRAPKADLQKIVHVTAHRAQQIRRLRLEQEFRSLSELSRVSGLGSGRIAEIRRQGLVCPL